MGPRRPEPQTKLTLDAGGPPSPLVPSQSDKPLLLPQRQRFVHEVPDFLVAERRGLLFGFRRPVAVVLPRVGDTLRQVGIALREAFHQRRPARRQRLRVLARRVFAQGRFHFGEELLPLRRHALLHFGRPFAFARFQDRKSTRLNSSHL